ncbi:SGNH/GDSL hydrolase family protein [Aestuariivivens sediminis]|uniref:SGNH/GDSL hydrolase family protein n=1 Tax=Aestuariivivens sediminis TaxID=2913557 RepID=UPI001F58731C|nr:SGNH/GDSL hydrolase family protein [Aestuariivivens sediminis]
MKKINYVLACYSIIIGLGCSTQHLQDNNINEDFNESESLQTTFRILALGDSYTIGQSVCESCKFPEQLKDSLVRKFEANYQFELKIIATTGWTTTNLIRAIETENITNEYDLVTLLIGVNNQYQNKSFSIYESEFPELVNTAIAKGKSDKNNCIVISIPDYAYTPFGNGNESISSDIDSYNNFAENYCETNGITYINITPITRLGLEQPELVASDGLHPSKLAYSKFVELMLPYAINKLKD